MSWYRDTYLKSPEWKATREAVIVTHHAVCALCGENKEILDVHHLTYKNLGFERLSELRPLCRKCHDKVHALFQQFPKLKKLSPRKQWRIVQVHLHRNKEQFKTSIARRAGRTNKKLALWITEFNICKRILSEIGIVYKCRMKWFDELGSGTLTRKNPIIFLHEYIRITKHDPRVPLHRNNPQRLLLWPHAH